MRRLFWAIPLVMLAMPALADCDEQITLDVEYRLPPLGQPVDVRALSCEGLIMVYTILDQDTASDAHTELRLRQRVLNVFRNEGLAR